MNIVLKISVALSGRIVIPFGILDQDGEVTGI